jgi:hypothetical protein
MKHDMIGQGTAQHVAVKPIAAICDTQRRGGAVQHRPQHIRQERQYFAP